MIQAFQIMRALARVHLLHKPSPLLALWNITFRCNLNCLYCGAQHAPHDELDTADVKAGLDTLWKTGIRWITVGGGEPLVRKDIISILQYARNKGFHVFLSTNGLLLPEKVQALSYVDFVSLSLDGGQETHEHIRGKGTFAAAIQAARLCREHKVPASFLCVLSSHNIERFLDVLEIAEAEGVPVGFQPATLHLNSSTKPNPLAPPIQAYRKALDILIERKKKGALIRNSLEGLRHLAKWPDPTPIWCNAGIISIVVEPRGQVIACHHYNIRQFLDNHPVQTIPSESPLRHERPVGCVQCWCANLVELGLVFSLRWEPMRNAWHYTHRAPFPRKSAKTDLV